MSDETTHYRRAEDEPTACGSYNPVEDFSTHHPQNVNCPRCLSLMPPSINTRMASMLRRLEWAGRGETGDPGVCPCCGLCEEFEHSPTCDLATLLRELP